MIIAVIPNADKPEAVSCAFEITKLLSVDGVKLVMPSWVDRSSIEENILLAESYEELFSMCDCAVTVGGDGTIIHCAPFAALSKKPLIGVNLGRIGYVAELEPSQINLLSQLVTGEYVTKERMMLDVTVIHRDGTSESYLAMNDAVISRGSLSCIIDLDVFVEGEKICNYRADGLLFSTPTGSTAYALSAGGPIIDPYLSLIELTPVCPHSLTARTVVFADDTVLSVSCNSPDTSFLTVDGQISVKLQACDVIRISKSEHKLSMNVIKTKNFYKVAGEKLGQPER